MPSLLYGDAIDGDPILESSLLNNRKVGDECFKAGFKGEGDSRFIMDNYIKISINKDLRPSPDIDAKLP